MKLQEFTKLKLARDFKDLPIPSFNMIGSQPLLLDEPKTFKNLGKINNFRSKDSLVFGSREDENSPEFAEELVSFEQGLQN